MLRGSSPLTRGKHPLCRFALGLSGLIPAHAGKTRRWPRRTRPTRAHPRSRGENSSLALCVVVATGSSPLTRGKRLPKSSAGHLQGLIPAHAGKTGSRVRSGRWKPAHPRSRGENKVHAVRTQITKGSSPLTRGKRRSGEPLRRGRGLIPAHAGKTADCCAECVELGAHPRSRGENAS